MKIIIVKEHKKEYYKYIISSLSFQLIYPIAAKNSIKKINLCFQSEFIIKVEIHHPVLGALEDPVSLSGKQAGSNCSNLLDPLHLASRGSVRSKYSIISLEGLIKYLPISNQYRYFNDLEVKYMTQTKSPIKENFCLTSDQMKGGCIDTNQWIFKVWQRSAKPSEAWLQLSLDSGSMWRVKHDSHMRQQVLPPDLHASSSLSNRVRAFRINVFVSLCSKTSVELSDIDWMKCNLSTSLICYVVIQKSILGNAVWQNFKTTYETYAVRFNQTQMQHVFI